MVENIPFNFSHENLFRIERIIVQALELLLPLRRERRSLVGLEEFISFLPPLGKMFLPLRDKGLICLGTQRGKTVEKKQNSTNSENRLLTPLSHKVC